jgi:ribonucleotide reductase alpha subunit
LKGSSTSSTDEDDVSGTADECHGEGCPSSEQNYEKTESVIKDHKEDNGTQTKTNANAHQKDHLRLSPAPQLWITQETSAEINAGVFSCCPYGNYI